ncbi:MAG: sulfotransferase [Desulfatitalea sp.]|nr:sulfotransferase [Desulfatitalea sp.]
MNYSNFLSRIALKNEFKYQFVVPETLPKRRASTLNFIENYLMAIDISNIRIEKPIFIVSLPRTGSSMLQDVLCKHPDITYITHLMHKYYPCFCAANSLRNKLNLDVAGERYLKDSVIVNSTSAADPVGIWSKWIGTDPFSSEYVKLRKDNLNRKQIDTIYATIKKVIWCSQNKASRFIMKMPGFIPYLPLLNDLFPDAKFIHLIRDPRKCVNSMLKLHRIGSEQLVKIQKEKKDYEYAGKVFVPYPHVPNLSKYIKDYGLDDIRTAAGVWRDSLEMVEKAQNEFGDFHNIRFEDILSDPTNEILKIIEFCELPAIKEDNAAFWDLISKIGITHHKNTYGDFDFIESLCKHGMEKYGYV